MVEQRGEVHLKLHRVNGNIRFGCRPKPRMLKSSLASGMRNAHQIHQKAPQGTDTTFCMTTLTFAVRPSFVLTGLWRSWLLRLSSEQRGRDQEGRKMLLWRAGDRYGCGRGQCTRKFCYAFHYRGCQGRQMVNGFQDHQDSNNHQASTLVGLGLSRVRDCLKLL